MARISRGGRVFIIISSAVSSFVLFFAVPIIVFDVLHVDNTLEAKNEFAQYFNGIDEVAVLWDKELYFENYTHVFGDEVVRNSITVLDNHIFWCTRNQSARGQYELAIHRSNTDGSNDEIVFSKANYDKGTSVIATGEFLFIKHYHSEQSVRETSIDRYNLLTNNYENVAQSEADLDVKDFLPEKEKPMYDIQTISNKSSKEHGLFVVTDLLSKTEYIIDDDFLHNTIYVESMLKFNYGPRRADISNGHIYLTYSIGAGSGWDESHLVFEYDHESNTIDYKLLAFVPESAWVNILCVN